MSIVDYSGNHLHDIGPPLSCAKATSGPQGVAVHGPVQPADRRAVLILGGVVVGRVYSEIYSENTVQGSLSCIYSYL